MSNTPAAIQYVPIGDTIADVAVSQQVSAGLTTSSSILLAMLVVASFVCNLALLATVLSSSMDSVVDDDEMAFSHKLRNSLFHLMFCSLGLWNIVDVLTIMFISLLYLSDGGWYFGDALCRLNAWAQEFIFLKTITNLMLMAMERALTLKGNHLVTIRHFWVLNFIFLLVPVCFAAPILFPSFPVKPYPNRYLCAVASKSPISYALLNLLLYGGCLFVLLLCFGSLLRHKSHDRSLPKKPQDYGAFIMESRALQDHLALGRLVLYMTIAFLLIEGPYITLNFFVQIRNSAEMLEQYGEAEIPQDVDIIATWMKFFFPLLIPLMIFISCADIWIKCTNLLLCRRKTPYSVWDPISGMLTAGNFQGPNNVLTLVATAEGLQLRVPTNIMHPQHPHFHSDTIAPAAPAQESNVTTRLSQIPSPRIYTTARRTITQSNGDANNITPVENTAWGSVMLGESVPLKVNGNQNHGGVSKVTRIMTRKRVPIRARRNHNR